MTNHFFIRITQRLRHAFGPRPETAPQQPAPPAPLHESIDALEKDPSLAWSLLNHRNGFVREAAVKALQAPIPDSFSFLSLASRLNDWVPQVREAAVAVFPGLAAGATSEQIDTIAPAFLSFAEGWSRMDQRGLAAVRAIVDTPVVKHRLIQRLMTSNAGGAGRRLRYLLRHDWVDPHLEEIARHAVQPAVRKSAYEALIYGEAKWWIGTRTGEEYRYAVIKTYSIFDTRRITVDVDLPALVRHGLSDRFAAVRWIAAGALIDSKVEFDDIETVISRLLMDKSRKVRERGEFLARRRAMTA